ncbi:ABC-2 transporter family protein [Mycolicibacterium hassiacum DSM 44199]|mgnify:CR=1 FL=1|jgi:ABC-2 type transport system permease protein|uniref:ABC-2 transporter family protein n=1 Tax=Mycolicibacterium hassiacum (strain DSM 44199 / CIP 105218 / JCM 12690 / 3849) TaxID=1122247 RepID=K5BFI5_MYCHD|nr:hypothetical protein [Mycolicibacterium hassiacum]EKF23181.1 ABC-2 transporter family protein [Mycolicibacterium hassiacum DSM 44199]MBX5485787.1 ABC transporter [Mycolicibacterium hassiacum]MDA4085527.1 exporter of polyketide antibiotics [Mycolicibacterium hassiacum DSM 44199]PZN22091.1 MAG: ABC transporter [Mycolicibacterium hassiacum]VCT89689.1 hypothetical protein MHAS_01386 [Mycolicibacterium hassiacum DSM 44199]
MIAAVVSDTSVTPTGRHPAAVRRLLIRQLRWGTAVVALLCGGVAASVAGQYQTISSLLNEPALQAIAGNPAEKVLLGSPLAIDSQGGFTVWRTSTLILLFVGLWAALTATRVSRGEEESGRWDLLLGGRLALADIIRQGIAAFTAAALVIGATLAVGLLAVGTAPQGTALFAAGVSLNALTFATVALFAAQLVPSRPAATAISVAVLAASWALRMLADSSAAWAWMAWTTPFGLVARSAPFAGDRILPLIVLAAFPMVFAAATLFAAHRRDLGEGLIAVPTRRPPRLGLLRSVSGFAARRCARTALGWALAVAAFFVLIGSLLNTVLQFFRTNPQIADLAAEAGIGGFDSVDVFAAPLFGILPVATGLFAVMRLSVMVFEERAGRWNLLLALPISRLRLLGAEVAVTLGAVALLHLVAAAAMWGGAALTGAALSLPDAVGGALNAMPIALLATGATVVGVGWTPHLAPALGALPLVGGFVVNAISQSIATPSWVANLSPWAHVGAVPAAPPHWTAIVVFLVLSAALTGFGLLGYERRDAIG